MTQKTTIFLPLWLGHMDMSRLVWWRASFKAPAGIWKLLSETSAYPSRQAKTFCPVATPGCACLPPGRRIHHLGILDIWLLLKFCSDFATKHMRPPRQALPSFRVEMVLCRCLSEVLAAAHGAQPMAPKRHGYKITDLFQNLIA